MHAEVELGRAGRSIKRSSADEAAAHAPACRPRERPSEPEQGRSRTGCRQPDVAQLRRGSRPGQS
jgi:hypothetical protein